MCKITEPKQQKLCHYPYCILVYVTAHTSTILLRLRGRLGRGTERETEVERQREGETEGATEWRE